MAEEQRMSVRDQVFQLIQSKYPDGLARSDIRMLLDGELGDKQLSNALYNLKADAHIELEDGIYYATKKPEAKTEVKKALESVPAMSDLVERVKKPVVQVQEEAEVEVEAETVAEPVCVAVPEACPIDSEVSRFHEAFSALAEQSARPARPDDLSEVLNGLSKISYGIKDEAPVSAALLSRSIEYLENAYSA